MSEPLANIIKRYKADLHKVATGAVLELGGDVKKGTPVGNPAYWKRKPSPEFLELYRPGTARQGWSDNGALMVGRTYKFTNNVDYIRRLEYGWSPQARNPNGMLRINVKRWDNIVTNNARRNSRSGV